MSKPKAGVEPRFFLSRLQGVLEPLGFARESRVFHRKRDGLWMTVWLETPDFEPDANLVDIQIAVGSLDEKCEVVYYFSLAQAVFGGTHERFHRKRQGWPGVVIEGFVRLGVPFIESTHSTDDLVDGLLQMRIPPSRGLPVVRHATMAWLIATQAGLAPGKAARAVEMLQSRTWGWEETLDLRRWAQEYEMPLVLPDPPGFPPAPEGSSWWEKRQWNREHRRGLST